MPHIFSQLKPGAFSQKSWKRPCCDKLVQSYVTYINMGLDARTPVLSSRFASNKDADQPAHPHRMIITFVIHFVESIISKLDTDEISIF